MTEADKLRDYIAQKQGQIKDLEKQYGTGVRPSWVGEEIAILTMYRSHAIKQLETMK